MELSEQKRILALPKVVEVGRFWSVAPILGKPLQRLHRIHAWYTDQRIKTLLMPLTRQEDRLSLRALDWLVTNFAKKYNIVLADERTEGPPINVFDDYRSMLSFWRRRHFDPFRRHQRIYFMWQDEQETEPHLEETTLGQLNFLHWAESNGIIRYARDHVEEIEDDMAKCMLDVKAAKKQDKIKGVKRKRRELSKAPQRQCYIYPIQMQVQFDPLEEEA